MKKIIVMFSLLFSFLLPLALPVTAHAQVSSVAGGLQEEFGRQFLADLTSDLITNPVVGWNSGGIVKVIFTICFAIALVQALDNSNPTAMVTEMMQLAIWTWLIIALLGGPTYQRFSFLRVNNPKYQTSGASSLDVDIFNFIAYQADTVAKEMFKASGPDRLLQAQQENRIMLENLMNSRINCPAGGPGASCVQCYVVKGKDGRLVTPDQCRDQTAQKNSAGWLASATLPDWLLEWLFKIYTFVGDYMTVMFIITSFFIDLLRAGLNMFILIAFGILTGMSFFLMKFIYPFAIMKRYRGRVLDAMKIPMSAALYSFSTSLIVYVSGATFVALNKAMTHIIVDKLSNGQGSDLIAQLPMMTVSVYVGQIIVMILQLIAIVKIPKLSKDLFNLSLSSIVNFAEEAIKAGGALALSLAGAGVGMAAGAAAGGLSSVAGRAVGSVKGLADGVGQRFGIRSPIAGLKFPNFGSGGASGGSAKGGGLSKGGTTSIGGVDTALGDAVSRGGSGGTSGSVAQSIAQEKVIPPKPVSVPKDDTAKFSSQEQQTINKGLSPDATEEDKKAAQDLNQSKQPKENPSADGINFSMKGLAGGIGGMMAAGFAAGAGDTGGLSKMLMSPVGRLQAEAQAKTAGIEFQNNYGASRDSAMSSSKNMVTNFGRTAVGSERAGSLQAAFQSMNKQKMDGDSQSNLDQTLSDFREGKTLSDEQYTGLMNTQNTKSINADQVADVNDALNLRTRESLARIEQNKGTEADFTAAFRAQNGNFASDSTKDRLASVSEKSPEYQKYAQEQQAINDKFQRDMETKGFNSKRGAAGIAGLSERVESGMMNRDLFNKSAKTQSESFVQDQTAQRHTQLNGLVKDFENAGKRGDTDAQDAYRKEIEQTRQATLKRDKLAFSGDNSATAERINKALGINVPQNPPEAPIDYEKNDPELYAAQRRQESRRAQASQQQAVDQVSEQIAARRENQGVRIGEYEFIRGENGVDGSMYAKGNDVTDDFSQIDDATINSLKNKIASIEARLSRNQESSFTMNPTKIAIANANLAELQDIVRKIEAQKRGQS